MKRFISRPHVTAVPRSRRAECVLILILVLMLAGFATTVQMVTAKL